MDSLRFSTFADIYKSEKCKLWVNFDPHVVNSIAGIGFLVHTRKSLKISRRCSLSSNSRPEQIVRDGSETDEDYNVVLIGESLTLKNPSSTLVEVQNKTNEKNAEKKNERKIWSRVAAMSKTMQRRGQRRVSTRNRQPLDCERDEYDRFEDVLSTIKPERSVEHCNAILRLLEKSNAEKTIEFFKWMKSNGKLRKNATAYNLALRALARREDWSMAKSLLEEMTSDSGCELTSQAFNALIFVCAKRGIVGWGARWFRMMLDKGVEPNEATIGMLMGLYQRNANLPQAEFTFDQMRRFKLKCIKAYSAMITIYTRLGLYNKSEEVISLMEEDEVIPSSENWLVRINTYSQQGKLDEAEAALKSMLASGIPPNIVAYNTLITGYGKVSNTKAASRLFQGLEGVGLEPDETTYRSMVEGFGRADNYKEALSYYNELKNVGFKPNSSNFYTMINLQARHKDDEGTITTLKDMRDMGCQYSSILTSFLQAYERVGRIYKMKLYKFYKRRCGKILILKPTCTIY